jgi:protein-S-isoprenylcysteine O-methyltransferase Ste14
MRFHFPEILPPVSLSEPGSLDSVPAQVWSVEMAVQYLAVVSGLIAILAPLIRVLLSAGRARSREIGWGSTLRKWPAAAAITVGLITLGALFWKPLPVDFPPPADHMLTAVGSLLYFPAILIYLWGLATLGQDFGVSTSVGADLYADHQLVTEGPYRFSRHPMYLAVMLAAAGALLIFRTWAMVIFLPMSLVVIRRADMEEKLLEEAYPEGWQEYSRKVPKWLPCCLGKRKTVMGAPGKKMDI